MVSFVRIAARQSQLPLYLDRAGGQRNRRPFQQHRRVQPGTRRNTHSGLVVSGVMLSRAIPAVLAGPIAGVLLDRLDRKRVMIASDSDARRAWRWASSSPSSRTAPGCCICSARC